VITQRGGAAARAQEKRAANEQCLLYGTQMECSACVLVFGVLLCWHLAVFYYHSVSLRSVIPVLTDTCFVCRQTVIDKYFVIRGQNFDE
jgi:hypothetical protein